MLKIGREQRRQLVAGSPDMLFAALGQLVREEHPTVVADLPDALLRRLLARGVDEAQRYGLVAPDDVATFVLLMFEFGPEFHRHPDVLDRLTDRARPAHERLVAVVRETPEAVWREIESSLARQHWFP